MALAEQYKIRSIAFPLLSAGIYGYPKREAITVAIETLLQYENTDIDIYLILYNSDTYMLANRILAQLNKK